MGGWVGLHSTITVSDAKMVHAGCGYLYWSNFRNPIQEIHLLCGDGGGVPGA